jgi:hypothetical protein
MAIKPYSKARNTAFRILSVLLYGIESGLPYIKLINDEGRWKRIRIISTPCAYSQSMTIWRMKQHIEWLEEIGLVENISFNKGYIDVSVKFPHVEEGASLDG